MKRKSDEELKKIFNVIKDLIKSKVDFSVKVAGLHDLENIYNNALQQSDDIKTIENIKKYLEKCEKKYKYKEYKEEKIDDYIMKEWK